MSKRIKWIDFGKGFTILLVVIGHVSLGLLESGSFNNDTKFLLLLVQLVYVFHMPVFFALSGYFFKIVDSKNDFIEVFKKKIISLGIPYVAFSLVMLCVKRIGGGSVRRPVDIMTFLNIYKQPIDHLWFLYALFGIYIYMSFLSLYIKNNKILLLVSLLGYGIATLFPTNIYIVQRVLTWSPMFILGRVLRNIQLKKYMIYLSSLGYIVYLIIWLIFNFKTRINYSVPGMEGIIFLVSIVLAFSVYPFIREDNKFFRYFTRCGKESLPIFLMHAPIASVIRIVLLKLGITQIFIQLIVGIVGAWFISIIIFRIVHRIKYLDFFLYPMEYLRKN
ncbi:acyltransferase family protein [Pediococcus pentosaceus]|uniref:acyltransferase family protein n=1 Tax=Pediococcus pentosaceus TaxID=1255 RepID=UPI00237FB63C|nr:acyltransferase family protein [Pediococcus pentosaceus]MDE3750535.1 acyltransferase family protein [Pediococcus pentosaceus]